MASPIDMTVPVSGRPVRVTSISFRDKSLSEVVDVVNREGARGADLIVLPETWRGQNNSPEPLDGPTIVAMATLAHRHKTYIVCPLDHLDGEQRFNSAILLDRTGAVVCTYNKMYPYWPELDLQPAVKPGHDAPVYQADFGRMGMAICFDANFPEVWTRLANQGAELVVWPSAYSAGTTLQAHALIHHFYVVTATQTRDCLAYDITGAQLLYEKADDINVTRITLDLDRGIYHENFNMEQRNKLLAERADEIVEEQHLEREQWFVLKARRPGIRARDLARQYGLEELRDYINRSRREIDKRRAEFKSEAATRMPSLMPTGAM